MKKKINVGSGKFVWIPKGYGNPKGRWMYYRRKDWVSFNQIWPPYRQATRIEAMLLDELWDALQQR